MQSSSASSGESSFARKASTRPQASPNHGVRIERTVPEPPARVRRAGSVASPSMKKLAGDEDFGAHDASARRRHGRRSRRTCAPWPTALPAAPPPPARQGAQVHRAGGTAGRHTGHRHFTCATIEEMEGMARAGLGDDLLLANEVVDATRLGALVRAGARVTVAVDSDDDRRRRGPGGVPEVLIDVNVGLPRCGCAPQDAGRLADRARGRGPGGARGHGVRGPHRRAGGARRPARRCSRFPWRC